MRRKKAWGQILDLGRNFFENRQNESQIHDHWVDHLPQFVEQVEFSTSDPITLVNQFLENSGMQGGIQNSTYSAEIGRMKVLF